MSDKTFDNIWSIMTEYKFELEHDISNDLKCVICLKMLINASNAPCGCRYCLHCIEKYLSVGNEYCPSKMKECLEEKLNFDKDIQIDRVANKCISKVKVKCPEQSCRFVDELRNIEYHMRVCDARGVSCPYLIIGCNESHIALDRLQDHLATDNYPHTKLLMECIENVRNEVEVFQRKLAKLEKENIFLKNENDIFNKKIFELEANCDQNNKQMKEILDKFIKMEDNMNIIGMLTKLPKTPVEMRNEHFDRPSSYSNSNPDSPTMSKSSSFSPKSKSKSGVFGWLRQHNTNGSPNSSSVFYTDPADNGRASNLSEIDQANHL